MNKEELLRSVAARLSENGFESAVFEAAQLCLDINKFGEVSETAVKDVFSKVERRLKHEPLQYILGEWEFCGLTLKVGRGVLIPRQDTETLVETLLPVVKSGKTEVADLCAGSGCIGIALEKLGGAKVTMLEKSRDALKYLKENVRLNGCSAEVLEYDVLGEPLDRKFDIIVSNPPYIRREVIKTLSTEVGFEPTEALDGGDDGLIFYRYIANNWKKALNEGGYIAFEIGFDQEKEVCEIAEKAGFKDVTCRRDLCGQPRVVTGHI